MKSSEQNTEKAFLRSFSSKFGIETDVRDYDGQIVISHDIPEKNSFPLAELFQLYNQHGKKSLLALNIKSDGLQTELLHLLNDFEIENYFFFDCSGPEFFQFKKMDFPVFSRQSEFEPIPSFYDQSDGIWLDEFGTHWINDEIILKHLNLGKKVGIVSPEIHGRNYVNEWREYKEINQKNSFKELILCTDYPEKAREFFGD